jgi:hypothetical protein
MKALPSPCRMKGSIATFLRIRMLLCHSVAKNAPQSGPAQAWRRCIRICQQALYGAGQREATAWLEQKRGGREAQPPEWLLGRAQRQLAYRYYACPMIP